MTEPTYNFTQTADQLQAAINAILNIVANGNSVITNSAGYLVASDIAGKADASDVYTKSQTYNKTEVDAMIALIKQFEIVVADELPAASASTMNKIYLIPSSNPETQNVKDEYITVRSGSEGSYTYAWEQIGSTSIDLSAYSTTEEMNVAIATAIAGKADKDPDAVEGNIAKFDSNGNPVDGGIPANNVAQKDGYYERMAVGIAKNIEGISPVTDSFMERTTGGDAEVSNGIAQITEVAGKSQVWNQLANNLIFPNAVRKGVTFSHDEDGNIVANGTVSSTETISGWLNINVNSLSASHTLYISRYIISGTISGVWGFDYNPVRTTRGQNNERFLARGSSDNSKSIVWFDEGCVFTNAKIFFNVIDLTLLFGSGNEPSTVEEFEAWLAENIGLRDYYPYNAGTVLNAKMEGIESLGFNLLDPATGKARIIGAYSDVYGNYYGITGTHGALTFTSDLGEESTITPDSDGKFQLETPGWLDVATPGEDCCVFIWWDGSKTDYVEHEVSKAYIDVTHIWGKLNGAGELVQIWPSGMAGVGTAKDVLRNEGGVAVARKRVERRAYASGDESDASVVTDGSTYTFYALETEELYTDLVYQGSDHFADGTPVTLPVSLEVDNWGIERAIPQNDESLVTSAPEVSILYAVDAAEELDTIRTSGIFVEDLKANLNALLAVVNEKLATAMGGTISLGSTPVDKVYPVIFTPTPEPDSNNE